MEKNVEFGEKQAQVNKIVVMHMGGAEILTFWAVAFSRILNFENPFSGYKVIVIYI